jgi:aconitate hydratase
MSDLDSTPRFVLRVYETMNRNLRIVREKLNRPLTLADKVLLSHLDDPEVQEMIAGSTGKRVRQRKISFLPPTG